MFFLQPLNVFYWILKRFPAFGKACCQATIIFEILSRNDDFGFGRVARSHKTFGCCKLIHTTNKLWPVPQCQNFNQTRPPNPFFTTCPGMTLKTLISKTFVLLWIVIYDIKFIQHQNQRHQCHHRARRSLLQQHLACFLLSGSPGQAPILHCSVHGCQQGQAHIISLVKILAPDANHIIIPYSCARHKARTSKKQQQIKFSKPEHWFFTQSVIPGHHCFGQDFSFNMQIITLYHIPALIIKPKQVKYNKKSHFLILNIDFIFRASFRDNWFQEKAVK